MLVDLLPKNSLLIAAASPQEVTAVLKGLAVTAPSVPAPWQTTTCADITILHTGVGKSNAAGSVGATLAHQANSVTTVVALGLAGSLNESIRPGDCVLGNDFVYLDEGTILADDAEAQSATGWKSLEDAGWSDIRFTTCTTGKIFEFLTESVDHIGTIGTVSTISGTDAQRDEYKRRFAGVDLETMESASIAQVCSNLGIAFYDVRVVSNMCGNRKENQHDFPGALKRLERFVAECTSQQSRV